jgi:hypothetical protein
MRVRQNSYVCVYFKTRAYAHTQTSFVCVYLRTRTYACTSKLVCMRVLQNSCVCTYLRTCAFVQTALRNWMSEIFQISTSQAHLQYYKPTDIDLHPNVRYPGHVLRCSLRLEIRSTFGRKPAGGHLWTCVQEVTVVNVHSGVDIGRWLTANIAPQHPCRDPTCTC